MLPIAAIIIRNANGRYLLQFRDDNPGINNPLSWGFWGGAVEEGDATPAHAARREVEEELGRSFPLEEFERIGVLEREAVSRRDIHFFMLRRRLEWGDFTPQEGAGAAYFRVAEMRRINLVPSLADFLAQNPHLFPEAS